MKDKELESLLGELKFTSPEEQQIQRWQASVKAESLKYPRPSIKQMWWQWLVAAGIGFACASIYFHQPSNQLGTLAQENNSDDATYEYVYSK